MGLIFHFQFGLLLSNSAEERADTKKADPFQRL